jgi:hypothetical protein
MKLPQKIIQMKNETETLLKSTIHDLNAVRDRHVDTVSTLLLQQVIDQFSLMVREVPIRLQNEWNGSAEQENLFRENSQKVISMLRGIKTSLGNKEGNIARIVSRRASICPIWPFC